MLWRACHLCLCHPLNHGPLCSLVWSAFLYLPAPELLWKGGVPWKVQGLQRILGTHEAVQREPGAVSVLPEVPTAARRPGLNPGLTARVK